MAEKEATSKGLPVVTEDTVNITFRSHEKGSEKWGDRLERTKRQMVQEQPHLVKFIESQVGKYPKGLHNALFEIAVGTYALLEQQSRSNRLSSSFSVGSENKS